MQLHAHARTHTSKLACAIYHFCKIIVFSRFVLLLYITYVLCYYIYTYMLKWADYFFVFTLIDRVHISIQ